MRHFEPSGILAHFERAATELRQVRARAQGLTEEELQAEAEVIYRRESIFMDDVVKELEQVRLADLPIAKQ